LTVGTGEGIGVGLLAKSDTEGVSRELSRVGIKRFILSELGHWLGSKVGKNKSIAIINNSHIRKRSFPSNADKIG
jgi:hypothetical protein